MNKKVLEQAAWRSVLGLLRPDDLIDVGVRALESGCDSPSLRALAGLNACESQEARPIFGRVLSELDVAMPSQQHAVMQLARETAHEILAGTTGAYLGARRIWDLTLCASGDDFPELHPFIYAASEWEDRPEDRTSLEDGILATATDLVNG